MAGPTWWQAWHGSPFPASTGAAGGSTAMSTGVAQALSSKAETDAMQSTLSGLASQVSTKAAGTHGHVLGDCVGLESTLAAISALVATKADSTHTHPGGGASGMPSTWVVLSTHVLTGSTTRQNVAGLSFAVSSASVYRFEFTGAWQTISSATGLALGVNGPAAPVFVTYEVRVSSGFGPAVTKIGRAFDVQTLASPGSSAANLTEYFSLWGVVRTGANAGTLQPQFASEVAGSTVSLRGGSVGVLWGPL